MVFRSDDAAEADEAPPGSARLTLCVNGATKQSLVHVLKTMIGQDLITSSPDASGALEPFTGTLDELLAYQGLRRGDSQTST
jgi:hypothetical protein